MHFMKTMVLLFIVFAAQAGSPAPATPEMPDYDETGRVLTLNNMGWMHPIIDPITEQFIKFCDQNKRVLEVGASYGYASNEALKRNAKVWINDLDNRHLEIFKEKIADKRFIHNATLSPGDFPEELSLQKDFFDAILAVRVFHFFSPQKLALAAKSAYDLLKKGGKIYIVAETPYLKNWSGYIPVYERKKAAGDPYPGYFTNPSDYNKKNAKYLPKALHFLDPEVLTRIFTQAGFKILEARFMERKDYPVSLQLDGRESVGFIACKE